MDIIQENMRRICI